MVYLLAKLKHQISRLRSKILATKLVLRSMLLLPVLMISTENLLLLCGSYWKKVIKGLRLISRNLSSVVMRPGERPRSIKIFLILICCLPKILEYPSRSLRFVS